jgi:hypothetical protein
VTWLGIDLEIQGFIAGRLLSICLDFSGGQKLTLRGGEGVCDKMRLLLTLIHLMEQVRMGEDWLNCFRNMTLLIDW